jgi:transcription elongation factor GreB
MSKAFTREDDSSERPVATPVPRPAPGEVRYVTPEGFRALQAELVSLDPSSRRAQVLAATLPLLTVHLPRCDGSVAFGCWVSVRDESGEEAVWRIVGQDEADVRRRRLSVSSPLGRALLGKQAGDAVTVELPRGQAELEVLHVGAEPPGVLHVDAGPPGA